MDYAGGEPSGTRCLPKAALQGQHRRVLTTLALASLKEFPNHSSKTRSPKALGSENVLHSGLNDQMKSLTTCLAKFFRPTLPCQTVPAAGDLDGDGVAEVVVGTNEGYIRLFRTKS